CPPNRRPGAERGRARDADPGELPGAPQRVSTRAADPLLRLARGIPAARRVAGMGPRARTGSTRVARVCARVVGAAHALRSPPDRACARLGAADRARRGTPGSVAGGRGVDRGGRMTLARIEPQSLPAGRSEWLPFHRPI